MKLKVAQVTYDEAEINGCFLVLNENQLKPLLVAGLDGPHEGYATKEQAIKVHLERDKKRTHLIVAELYLRTLKDDKLSLDGETIVYNGKIGQKEVKAFSAYTATDRKPKAGRKKKTA